jgi:hypothetical protein
MRCFRQKGRVVRHMTSIDRAHIIQELGVRFLGRSQTFRNL